MPDLPRRDAMTRSFQMGLDEIERNVGDRLVKGFRFHLVVEVEGGTVECTPRSIFLSPLRATPRPVPPSPSSVWERLRDDEEI